MSKVVKKSTAVATVASEEALALIRQNFPTEVGFNRVLLPRFGLVSQDITEETKVNGKKHIKVVTEAGTFFVEKQEGEVDKETGNKGWVRTEIGDSAEGIIVFQRKQLKYFDPDKEEFTSSTVYDNNDEIVSLFLNKKVVEKGTPAELKALYPGVNDAGKAISKLEENRVVYVLIDGEIYQLNLRGSSMYSYLTYQRKVTPPTVLTKFSSEYKEKGTNNWNMMKFEPVRAVNADEAQMVIEKTGEIIQGIQAEKSSYASSAPTTETAEQKSMRAEAGKAARNF